MDAYLIACFVCIVCLFLSNIILSHCVTKLEKFFKLVCKNVYDEIDK